MDQTRMSVASVVASSAVSVLAASMVLLVGGGLALANPNTGPYPQDDFGVEYSDTAGLDLPMAPPTFGAPAPVGPPAPEAEPDAEPWRDDETEGDSTHGDEPPPFFFGEEIDTASDSILYVVDISGSMSIRTSTFEDHNGEVVADGTRLDRAKAELKRSIGGLPESFSFNVFVYDECVSGIWGKKQAATYANKAAAFAWIDAVQPNGWTNTGLAVTSALRDKENLSVVLLSDGSPNFLDCAMNYVGSFDDHANLIRGENTQGAVVDTFGIGVTHDSSARAFMQRVASENRGRYVEIN